MINLICWPAAQIFTRLSAKSHKNIATSGLLLALALGLVDAGSLIPSGYSGLVAVTLLIITYLLCSLLQLYMVLLQETQSLISALSRQNLDARLGLSPYKSFQPLALLINTLGRQYQRLNQFVRSSAGEAQFTASELETTSLNMARNAEEQHQRLSSAAAAAEEISATLAEITSHIEKTQQISLDSYEASQSGQQQAHEAIQEIRHVVTQVNATESHLRQLRERTEEITTVTASIESISQQINLLALNASIEAARAGDAGRGFAVVADEVRNLALRTQKATVDISTRLEAISTDTAQSFSSILDSQQRVQRASDKVEATGHALEQIQTGAEQTRDGVQAVSTSIKEHLQVSQDMARTLEIIAGLADQTRQSTEKTQDMVHYLNELSRRLNNQVPQAAH